MNITGLVGSERIVLSWRWAPGHSIEKNGVAVVCEKEMAECVLRYNSIVDRIFSVWIQGRSINTTIFQVYAPTADADEELHDDFCGKLQDALNETHRGNVIVVMGDFNAKGAEKRESRAVGGYGLWNRNTAGEMLIEFCEGNDPVTLCQHTLSTA